MPPSWPGGCDLVRPGSWKQNSGRILALATWPHQWEPIYRALVRKLVKCLASATTGIDCGGDGAAFKPRRIRGVAAGDPRSVRRHDAAATSVIHSAWARHNCRLPDDGREDPGQGGEPLRQAIARPPVVSAPNCSDSGCNGHVGFNEPPLPGSAAWSLPGTQRSTREQNSADFGGDPMAGPSLAITLGLAEILQASASSWWSGGGGKARILRRAAPGPARSSLRPVGLQGQSRR